MELNFKKKSNGWVAEFEATGAFNLHIERTDVEFIQVFQKSVLEGEYATFASWSQYDAPRVLDIDFAGLIYPKYLKVVSLSEVTKGVVTFNE